MPGGAEGGSQAPFPTDPCCWVGWLTKLPSEIFSLLRRCPQKSPFCFPLAAARGGGGVGAGDDGAERASVAPHLDGERRRDPAFKERISSPGKKQVEAGSCRWGGRGMEVLKPRWEFVLTP